MDIVEQRAEHYGDYFVNWARIAKLWSAYLGHDIDPHDAAMMMILLKASRSRQAFHEDNYVDISGYAEIAMELGRCRAE